MSNNGKEIHPRVFISYSHDSPEHADKVLEFANKLRSEGIDAILDQYEPWPEKGWPQWMLQQVSEADFVLMICTEMYYKGVMEKLAPGEKRGIKYEWNLINNHFYKAGSVNKRFLPVLMEKTCVEWIPDPFQAMPWFCVVTDEGYEDLYRRLTGQQTTKKPDLGKLKSLGERKPKTNFFADTSGDVHEGEEMKNSRSVKKGGISEEIMSMREKLHYKYFIVGILVTLAIIFIAFLVYRRNEMPKSPLVASVVDFGYWKAPFYVEEELKGMQKVSHSCESFKKVMPADDTFKKTFSEVHEFSSEIISEIERLEPCEADNVTHLKSIHSILVKNDGSKVCEDLKIIFQDAKYIEFKKEGEKRQKFQNIILVKMGDLDSSVTIEIDVWATCPAGEKPEFKITSRGQPADVFF